MAFVPGKLARRTTGGVSRRNSALAPWLLVASLLHCLLDRRTQAQSVSGVRSTYNVYDPAGHDYELAGLYCATWDSDQSYAWRSEYKWTAYCAGGGPSMGQSLCGQCLQVTNEDTQDSIVVRIVDQCSNGGLDLETDAFNAIDSDGQGYNNGHLTVDIQFVDC